jgi:putative aldouronate transport system permease protein
MMFPGLVYLLINNYLPMLGVIIAFKNVNYSIGILKSPWVGLSNFKYLFSTRDAFVITRNTLLYNGSFIIVNTIAAIAIAILLNEIKNRYLSRLHQTIVLLPYLVSMVIVGYLVYAGLSPDTGFVNKSILPALNIEPISWYTEPKYWPFILTSVNLWKGIGFYCVIYLATIVGISRDYYESAMLDGATKWQQIYHITLPLLKQVVILMVLLSIGRIFYSDFGLFYQVPMNSGTLFETTNVIDTYVYRALLQLGDIGMSSAAGLYQSFVGFTLVLLSNFVIRKISPQNAIL